MNNGGGGMRDSRDEFVRRIVAGLQKREMERQEAERRARRLLSEGAAAQYEHITAAARKKHRGHINRRKA